MPSLNGSPQSSMGAKIEVDDGQKFAGPISGQTGEGGSSQLEVY